MKCKVYVFESLGVPFLLGTNSLWENDLVIDTYNKTLYTSPALSNGKTCSTALQCKRTPITNTSAVQQVDSHTAPEWTNKTSSCDCTPQLQLQLDRGNRTLSVITGNLNIETLKCNEPTEPTKVEVYRTPDPLYVYPPRSHEPPS